MRISIFVDGNNLYKLCKSKLGWSVDLEKLIQHYNAVDKVVDAFYYSAIDNSKPLGKFFENLSEHGFVLVSKPLKRVGYGDESHLKGNMDVEMVMDMFNTIDLYDMAVLVSGDGDFLRPLEHLRARGKRFEVLSHPSIVARELVVVAGMHYVNISTLENELRLCSGMEDIPEMPEEVDDIDRLYPFASSQ